jgi:hypothetical protein
VTPMLMEMHRHYLNGLSLAAVGKLFRVTRQSVYAAFKSHGLSTRKKPTPAHVVVFMGKRYTRRPHGYFASTDKTRTYLHRDIWVSIHGQVPPGMEIHHKDENPANNHPANLVAMSGREHRAQHGKIRGSARRARVGNGPCPICGEPLPAFRYRKPRFCSWPCYLESVRG